MLPLSADTIKSRALALGFTACGMTQATAVSPQRERTLREWVAKGLHGEMNYLAERLPLKLDPCLLVEGARTIVSLAVNYYPGEDVKYDKKADEKPLFARYARGADYHDVVKAMLRRLMTALGLVEGEDGRCFVDTAPVDEKYWAERCGVGWRGRNGQLIIPGAGSYFFLGELILTREVDHYDIPAVNRCGTCHACLESCPAKALLGDGTMDARRCLSYLTIEYRGELPEGVGRIMSPYIYGCDRCSEVCPWNRFARQTQIPAFLPRPELLKKTIGEWLSLTKEEYTKIFRKSAVKRAKYEGLMRNIRAVAEELVAESNDDVSING